MVNSPTLYIVFASSLDLFQSSPEQGLIPHCWVHVHSQPWVESGAPLGTSRIVPLNSHQSPVTKMLSFSSFYLMFSPRFPGSRTAWIWEKMLVSVRSASREY